MKKILVLLLFLLTACATDGVSNNQPHEAVTEEAHETVAETVTATESEEATEEPTTIFSADYRWFDSVSDMSSQATDVIRAKLLDVRTQKIDTRIPPRPDDPNGAWNYTVFSLEVIDVFKGNFEVGELVEVKQLQANDNTLTFDFDADMVLFLESYSDLVGMPASLLNPVQAAYLFEFEIETPFESVGESAELEAGESTELQGFSENNTTSPSLKSFSEQNNLELTLDDLRKISENHFN
ncbi:MAG: hypothetical protein FWG87_02160 [Defluviitaleaceae bacterium]|nr:hypothetical protein [Defluviitaleaceae bacterium]